MTKTTSLQPDEVLVDPVFAIQEQRSCRMDPQEIAQAFESAFGDLHRFAGEHHLQLVGPPRAIYTEYSARGTTFTVALPVAPPTGELPGEGPVTTGTVPGGKTLRFTHNGPYSGLRRTYDAITAWMKDEGLMKFDADWAKYSPVWEEYMNDPRTTAEAELLTYVYVPIGEGEEEA